MLDLNLEERIFRPNPAFGLVEAGRVPENRWPDHVPEGFYGWFVPRKDRDKRNRSLPANAEAALLYQSLKKPGKLPYYLLSRLDVPMTGRIVQLLLAGVLDVECGGEFVTGFRAVRLLESASNLSRKGGGGTRALSEAGLEHAYRFTVAMAGEMDRSRLRQIVSQRLYMFNAIPPSGSWRQRLSSESAVLDYLNIGQKTSIRTANGQTEWTFHPSDPGGWWHAWHPFRRESALERVDTLRDRTWGGDAKLYISPLVADLPEVLKIGLPIIFESPAVGAKVGSSLSGIFRPDKLVAYFASFEDLLETSNRLSEALEGMSAQGVPFTADLTQYALMSWGTDAFGEPTAGRRPTASWRIWISEILGNALVDAYEREYTTEHACAFAKTAAEIAGIDTDQWCPKAHLMQTTA